MSVINVGGGISFSCSATAIPQPTIMWSRTTYYGTEMLSHNSSENIMIDDNVLTVSSAQYYRDNGTYSCIATNSRGSNYSFVEVKVHGKSFKLTCKWHLINLQYIQTHKFECMILFINSH